MTYHGRHLQAFPQRGFSLVEIMVAVLIGLIGILVIMQVFATFEGQKRTTTGSADAQENGLIGLFSIEREVRVAGLGFAGLACTTVNAYNAKASPATFTFNPWPVTIIRNDPAADTKIVVVYSTSPFGHVSGTLSASMATSADALVTTNGQAFAAGDIFLISQGAKACSIGQVSAAPTQVGATTSWTIPHNSGASFPFNPPGGQNIFKDAGGNPISYDAGAKVTNLGQMISVAYFVQNNSLMMQDLNAPVAAGVNPVALVNGIAAIRAQYGRDTTVPPDGYADTFDNTDPTSSTSVVAVRLAVVAQSGQQEKESEAPTTDGVNRLTKLVLWDGGTVANGGEFDLDATAQLFRHKVFATTIPLRNVIWNN